MPRYITKNRSVTALTTGIDDTVTTFVVDDPTLLPTPTAENPFVLRFRIGALYEYMVCTDITGSTCTITARGAEGSTAQAWVAGAEVTATFSQAVFDKIDQMSDAYVITALDVDASKSGLQTKSISSNETFTFSNLTQGQRIRLEITSSSSAVLTLPASCKIELGVFKINVKNTIDIYVNDGATEQTATITNASGSQELTTAGTVATLNRTGSDGTIQEGQKDATSVYKILSRAGLVGTFIFDPRTNGAGLTGSTDAIWPTDETGSPTNGVMDLGGSSNTCRSLYLSGVVNTGAGAVGAPSINFGDATTGFYKGATDVIAIATGGVLRESISSAGHNFNSTNLLNVGTIDAENAGTVATLNRTSTDGDVISIEKDGVELGVIGIKSSDFYMGHGITGLFYAESVDAVTPFNTDTQVLSNGLTDLGYSTAKFKDLLLSGQVNCATVDAENAGTTVATFNRTGADGEIIALQDAGVSAGRLGNWGGDMYLGTSLTGLRFLDSTDQIVPFNTSSPATTDGATDLGKADARFKNLYLSGGAYLGGTASNNLLSAMDRQSFTPTFTNFTIGNGSVWGYYQTINDVCHVAFGFIMGSTSAVTANLGASGLPETSSNNGGDVKYWLNAIMRESGVTTLGGYGIVGNNSTLVGGIRDLSDAPLATTVPFTWGTGDTLTLNGSYPIN